MSSTAHFLRFSSDYSGNSNSCHAAPAPLSLSPRTYLFCAIRPEVTYHKYTFATLGFAKNASVVKLKPKIATVKATPAEKKLMEELEQMKVLIFSSLYCSVSPYPINVEGEDHSNGRHKMLIGFMG